MKTAKNLLIVLLLLLPFAGQAATQKIDDFALIDHNGRFHKLSKMANRDAIVLFIQGNGCAISRNASTSLTAVRDNFAEHNIEVFMLNANTKDSREAILAEAQAHNITLPILMDDTQLVAEALGATHTGEVYLIKPSTRELVYRGPISTKDKNYLQDAMASLVGGDSVAATKQVSATSGNKLQFPYRAQHANAVPSYQKDIAPILQERCVSCHQKDGLAPWAMNSYDMVRGWAPMIREVIMSKRMPPGQIDPEFNHLFEDVAQLTIGEQQTLVNWIDAGAVNSEKLDTLAEININVAEWQLGEPDLIVEVPAQEIPATGVIDYRYEKIPLNLEQDIWVKAVEFLPSAHEVMHHIIAFSLDTPDFSEFQLLTQGVGLGAYAPGNQPTVFPDNTGYKLSAGGGLFLQLHYTTSGKAAVDKTRIGLYLLDEAPAIAMGGGSAAEFNLNIPPNVKESPMTADRTFAKDTYLVSLSPHMHFRGKKIKYTLIYPDGRREVILSVPNYQFNWQKNYDFKEPMFIPAGTRLVVDGAFDNSATNPNNPDPNITVTWGEQSWNEMFFGFYRYFEAEKDSLTKR